MTLDTLAATATWSNGSRYTSLGKSALAFTNWKTLRISGGVNRSISSRTITSGLASPRRDARRASLVSERVLRRATARRSKNSPVPDASDWVRVRTRLKTPITATTIPPTFSNGPSTNAPPRPKTVINTAAAATSGRTEPAATDETFSAAAYSSQSRARRCASMEASSSPRTVPTSAKNAAAISSCPDHSHGLNQTTLRSVPNVSSAMFTTDVLPIPQAP